MAPDSDLVATNVLVRSVTWQADRVVSLLLEAADGSPLPAWEPGAHIDLVLPDGSARQYSLSGEPDDLSAYRIAVLHEPDGRGGSEWAHRVVRPGDRATIRGPRNHFALEPAASYVFIAGGIGITPLLPMMRAASAAGIPWVLHYFGRTRRAMAFLAESAAAGGEIHVHARDEGRGEVADLLADLAEDALVYCCGPLRLSGDVSAVLTARGGADRLRTELFVAPDVAPLEAGGDVFRVALARTGVELDVPSDRTILAVVREAGVDILSDCEDGICGTCETTVLEGEVDHRDFVLTPQERAKNDCMMICVSRAACPRLVLDL